MRTAPGAAPGTGTPGMAARVITGTLDVQDESTRTFQLEGETGTFIAPSAANLDELDGEEVTVRVDTTGRVQSIERTDETDRPS
jgi:hypothetical protein